MDLQLLLVFILALLTCGVLFLCFYSIFVLKEFRETLRKTNNILDKLNSAANLVSNPLPQLAAFASSLIKTVKNLRSDE